MLTKSTLGERGWTEAAITRWLGEPDKRSRNPYSRSKPPVCLYLEARVVAVEASDDFQAWLVGRRARGERAEAAAKQKADRLVAGLKTWTPRLEVLPITVVRRAALDAYNARLFERGDDDRQPATEASDEAFLTRITVNYLRHQLTPYDAALDAVRGQVGVRRAEHAIRVRVYEVIAEKYPDLAAECDRQRRARGS